MKEGVFMHAEHFYLKFLDRKDNKPSLFAFVVPVKVQKTSVGRHFIKRKMSAVVEKEIALIKAGFSGIFFAKKDIFTVPYSDIKEEINKILMESKILRLNEVGF